MTKTELITTNNALPPSFGGQLPAEPMELRPLVAQAFEAWLNKTESKATRTAYRNDVEQFLRFQNVDIDHLETMIQFVPDDVTRWRDHLLSEGGRPDRVGNKTPGENSTVTRKITSLRSFFSFLQNYGYRGANPAAPDFVKAPKVSDKGLTPSILPKMVGQLLDAPSCDTPSGKRDRAVLAVFAYMALRVDELYHINVGNIQRDGEHTVVRIKGKGNELRRGVMPPIAASAVNEWIEHAKIEKDRSGPLFRPSLSPRGQGRDGFKRGRMTIRSIQRLVKKYCLAVGIDEEVSVHSLRVTAATEADKAGIPLIDIQHWLGHKDPRTTLRYIRGTENLDRSPAYTIRYG
ncbi:tyrosine-type recombinase/integrase [Crateriforma conspicua]|uniref:tyrosine-type recombinase/integrase n=1 Tax=Crateriforma conspicua TaxID=2527996 RepID=UPI001188D947|nr:tyrosine-type recombinase/integrase [Crateriforma conspicua]QDV61964.1 Tyrosine recombinase XerD [Crateriforma conspicua]